MFDANDLDLDNGLDALFASAATAARLGTVEIVEEAPVADEATAAYEDAGLDLAPAARLPVGAPVEHVAAPARCDDGGVVDAAGPVKGARRGEADVDGAGHHAPHSS